MNSLPSLDTKSAEVAVRALTSPRIITLPFVAKDAI